MTGDPAQLLPVLANPLYQNLHSNSTELAISGYEAYRSFNIVVELSQMIRQQNLNNCPKQQHFIELLTRLRNAESTIQDWNLLTERAPTPINVNLFENSLRLSDLNQAVDQYNKEQLEKLKNPITKITSSNSKASVKNVKTDLFGGLKNELFLCIDAKIVLTSNIW